MSDQERTGHLNAAGGDHGPCHCVKALGCLESLHRMPPAALAAQAPRRRDEAAGRAIHNPIGKGEPSGLAGKAPLASGYTLNPYESRSISAQTQAVAVAIGDVIADGKADVVVTTTGYFDPVNDHHDAATGDGDQYYTVDRLGSVRDMTNWLGAVEAEYTYDPWGRQTKVTGPRDADFGYAGYLQPLAGGPDLTWYRGYDPGTGRWLSRDPLGEDGGINLYTYAPALSRCENVTIARVPTGASQSRHGSFWRTSCASAAASSVRACVSGSGSGRLLPRCC